MGWELTTWNLSSNLGRQWLLERGPDGGSYTWLIVMDIDVAPSCYFEMHLYFYAFILPVPPFWVRVVNGKRKDPLSPLFWVFPFPERWEHSESTSKRSIDLLAAEAPGRTLDFSGKVRNIITTHILALSQASFHYRNNVKSSVPGMIYLIGCQRGIWSGIAVPQDHEQ